MTPKILLASYETTEKYKRADVLVQEVTVTYRDNRRLVEIAPVYVVWAEDFEKIRDRIIEIASLGEFWLIFPYKFQKDIEEILTKELPEDKRFIIEEGDAYVYENLLKQIVSAILRVLKAYFGENIRIVDICLLPI